jgi:putative membrane protein
MRSRVKKRIGRVDARGGEGSLWKGVAAGAVGGLAAAFVMNQFQAAWGRLAAGEERSHGAQSLQQGSPGHGVGQDLREKGLERPLDDATERLANAVSVSLLERGLTEREKDAAGTAFHYAMGLTSGAIYGAASEFAPAAKAGAGLPFGAAVWLVADEGLVPAAGLSKSAAEYPLSIHAYSIASHLVFGLATEVVRRTVRSAL